MIDPVIFREYDVRGVYPEQLNENVAESLGKAFASFIYKKTKSKEISVSLGYDARLSSPSLLDSLTKGLISSGVKVYNMGLITTPISYFSMYEIKDLTGAIMITGSHNPPNYNGFKISFQQQTLTGEEIQDLKNIIHDKEFISGSGDVTTYDIKTPYVDKYKKEFASVKAVPFVLDCGNGAAGSIVRQLLDSLEWEGQILFEEPNGHFPNHHPDPTVEENMQDLKNAVLASKALVGIGFDGDADRIGIVDETGQMLYGDELMVLFSRSVLKDNPGATIIGDVKCSDRLFKDIKDRGGEPLMWLTGHSIIKRKIKESGALFGGEMSGHVCFSDRNYGYDDAVYAALRVIEILSKSKKTISELLADFPPAFNTPEIRIDTTEEKKRSIVKYLKEKYPKSNENYKVNNIDGIRISFDDGWALARASNTQPVLVLRFESETEVGMNRIRNEIESLVNPLL